ncbi:MAG: insulinase family protein [Proteobacteria bacterium]|nr:insulinase family protein [Pseudomonadota bacterium]
MTTPRAWPAIVLEPRDAADVIAVQVWIGVGAADERPKEAGIAHVLEHMIFKGTARRPVGQLTRDIESAGGHINAWTSHDETVFHITVASADAEAAIDALFDAVANPLFDSAELRREQSVILEEIRMGQDSPEHENMMMLFRQRYRQHPYGQPVIGRAATVRRFTAEDLRRFHQKWYRPSNMVIAAAGRFDPETLRPTLERLWRQNAADLNNARPQRPRREAEPPQQRLRLGLQHMPTAEAQLAIGFPAVSFQHPDAAALDVLAAILGQGASARLEQRIRRARGLATDLRAMCYTPADAGIFTVLAATPAGKLPRLVTAIAKEMSLLQQVPVSQAELDKARVMLRSEEVYDEETVDGVARRLGHDALHGDGPAERERYNAALQALDTAALQQVAARYLHPQCATLSALVPTAPPARMTALKAQLRAAWQAPAQKPVPRRVRPRDNGPAWETHALSNGAKLLVRCDPNAQLVAARAAFLGGTRLEPASQAGVATLISALLTRGTRTRSADHIAHIMDNAACSIGGFLGRSTHGLAGEFLAQRFHQGFPLFLDCLQAPAFAPEEFQRERALLREEQDAQAQNPEYQLFARFHQSLFGAHPYGRPVSGTAETLSPLTPADLHAAFALGYAPANMVLAVDGPVPPDELVAILEAQHCRADAPMPALPDAPAPWQPPTTPRQTHLFLPKEQSHLLVGFPGIAVQAPERFAADLLVELLGGHGGRLFAHIREEQGLAYSVSALAFEGVDPGYIAIYGATSGGLEMQMFQSIRRELDRIRRTPPSADELQRVARHLIGARAIRRQRAATRAFGRALAEIYGTAHLDDARYAKQMMRVTPNAIRQLAERLFDERRMVVACVGPLADPIDFV